MTVTTLYCTDDIPNLGVPILSSVALPDSTISSTRVQISGACHAVCPFDEYINGSVFSYSDEVLKILWLEACYLSDTSVALTAVLPTLQKPFSILL